MGSATMRLPQRPGVGIVHRQGSAPPIVHRPDAWRSALLGEPSGFRGATADWGRRPDRPAGSDFIDIADLVADRANGHGAAIGDLNLCQFAAAV
jgi:hypothetical protein